MPCQPMDLLTARQSQNNVSNKLIHASSSSSSSSFSSSSSSSLLLLLEGKGKRNLKVCSKPGELLRAQLFSCQYINTVMRVQCLHFSHTCLPTSEAWSGGHAAYVAAVAVSSRILTRKK